MSFLIDKSNELNRLYTELRRARHTIRRYEAQESDLEPDQWDELDEAHNAVARLLADIAELEGVTEDEDRESYREQERSDKDCE